MMWLDIGQKFLKKHNSASYSFIFNSTIKSIKECSTETCNIVADDFESMSQKFYQLAKQNNSKTEYHESNTVESSLLTARIYQYCAACLRYVILSSKNLN